MTQTALTREQVLNAQPGDYLDLLVSLNVMGFEPSNQRSGWVRIGALATYPKRYSTDISAAWEVQEQIKDSHEIDPALRGKYVNRLLLICGSGFDFAHATPAQRCKAALLAVLDL